MKNYLFCSVSLFLFSFNSYAFTAVSCQELKSESLKNVCDYVGAHKRDTTAYWTRIETAGEVETSSIDDVAEVVTEVVGSKIYVSVLKIESKNLYSSVRWLFENDKAKVATFGSLVLNSGLEAYRVTGTFIYRYDNGYLVSDKQTNEVFFVGIGDD